MGRYALIITATGVVGNIIEYNGTSPFNPGTGMELREAGNNAEIGGTWNGSEFVRAPFVSPTREQILLYEVKNPTIADADTEEGFRDKTVEEVTAEKLELKALLLALLIGGTDLSHQQTQALLRLERE